MVSIQCRTVGCEGRAGTLTGFCERCQRRLRQRKVRSVGTRGAPAGGWVAVSEEQVAFMRKKRAAFWSNRRIAVELGLSVATVQKHLREGRG